MKNKENRVNKNAAKPETPVTTKISNDVELGYSYYSNVLKKPFTTIAELRNAEEAYYTELKAKEDRVAQKKADAAVVEEAFKALNTARKVYKEDIAALTKEYAAALDTLKKSFELAQKDIKEKLANAEEAYSKALKDFTTKNPEGFHITLKDGDFETTISGNTSINPNRKHDSTKRDSTSLMNLWDFFFNF